MPDLLTHTIVAYAAAARARRRTLILFVLGTVLPDAASVLPGLVLEGAAAVGGFEVAEWVLNASAVFHAPLPVVLLIWLLALWGPRMERWRILVTMTLGGWLHLGLDFLQFHLSGPSYFLLYPFSSTAWEAGWIGTEDSLWALPVLIPVALGVRSWRRRTRGPSGRAI